MFLFLFKTSIGISIAKEKWRDLNLFIFIKTFSLYPDYYIGHKIHLQMFQGPISVESSCNGDETKRQLQYQYSKYIEVAQIFYILGNFLSIPALLY